MVLISMVEVYKRVGMQRSLKKRTQETHLGKNSTKKLQICTSSKQLVFFNDNSIMTIVSNLQKKIPAIVIEQATSNRLFWGGFCSMHIAIAFVQWNFLFF